MSSHSHGRPEITDKDGLAGEEIPRKAKEDIAGL